MRRMLERAQNWAMGPPTLAEALEERPQQTSRVDAQVIWGPITKEVGSSVKGSQSNGESLQAGVAPLFLHGASAFEAAE